MASPWQETRVTRSEWPASLCSSCRPRGGQQASLNLHPQRVLLMGGRKVHGPGMPTALPKLCPTCTLRLGSKTPVPGEGKGWQPPAPPLLLFRPPTFMARQSMTYTLPSKQPHTM